MNGSTVDCDTFGLMNATAAATQINVFLCPSDRAFRIIAVFVLPRSATPQTDRLLQLPHQRGHESLPLERDPGTTEAAAAVSSTAWSISPGSSRGSPIRWALPIPRWSAGHFPLSSSRTCQGEDPIDIASITDGTSHTVAFSEWVRGDGLGPRGWVGAAERQGWTGADLCLQSGMFHRPIRGHAQHGLPVSANLR